MVLPLILGLRWTASSRREPVADLPRRGNTVWRGLQAVVDEVFLAAEILWGAPLSFHEHERIQAEVKEALGLYARRGWLADPASFHPAPPPPVALPIEARTEQGISFEQLSFESGYAPFPGEPGRERWLSYEENWTAHARLYRHADTADRPWIVCVPGYRMGDAVVDYTGFRIRWLHETLGFNVAVPVLPFHGPRQVGRRGGDGYLTGDFLDTIHAQAQTVWDVRRLLRWLEAEGASQIAVYGVSLGGYSASMIASLEPDLDCAIVGVPAIDFVDLIHSNAPAPLIWLSHQLGFPWDDIDDMLRVVSPLALSRAVPRERCFIFAGEADALAPPAHARDLWEHWDRPELRWYSGGHVSFVWEAEVEELLLHAFHATGMLAPPVAPRSLRLVS
ncbi:MAG: alpha/beta hydrolase family protein [Deltaproteobacteria bacterium]